MLAAALVMLINLESNLPFYIIPNTGLHRGTFDMANISVPIGANVRFHCTVANVEQNGVRKKCMNKVMLL